MGEPRRYRAYGLGIASELELPALAPGADGDPVDLEITRGKVDTLRGSGVRIEADRTLARFDGVGDVELRDGSRMVVDVQQAADPEAVNGMLCGIALAFLMVQRGFHVLHAGAVEFDGRAVAFAAGSGGGKSTMTAALHARGYRVVVDDVLVVDDATEVPMVIPGYPQLKLWPDSAGALGLDPAAMPAIQSGHDKRALRFSDGLADQPIPLERIYILDQGETVVSSRMTGGAAALALVGNGYAKDVRADFAEAADFERAAALANRVDVRLLERPWSLDELATVVALVERDALVGAPS